MKKIKILAVILALMLTVTGFMACKPSEKPNEPDDGEETVEPVIRPTKPGEAYGEGRTLGIHLYGQTPSGFDEVIEEYKRRTADIFAFDIEFHFYDIDTYKQTLTLNVANPDSNMDLVFDAQWINLQEWANNGNYVRLDGYFNNKDNFPGLYKAFDETYCENNKFNNGIYGVPLTETFGDSTAVFYRKDWAEASGIEALKNGIDNLEEFEIYLKWVKENKSQDGVVPFIANKDGNNSPYSVIMAEPDQVITVDQSNALGVKRSMQLKPGIFADAYIDPETGAVIDAYIRDYEEPSVLQSFPQPFNSTTIYQGNWQWGYTKTQQWMTDGYISSSIATEIDAVPKFKLGQAGSFVTTLGEYTRIRSDLVKNVPDAELDVYIHDKAIREKTPHIFQTDFKAWNFLAVPKSSPDLDLAMLFLDWIFSSRENHDLFQYGIEGKHWDKIDPAAGDEDGTYEYLVDPAKHEAYTFPGYLLTWNPTYLRMPAGASEKVREYTEFVYDMNTYGETLYSGFTFDFTPVDAELNNAAFGTGASEHIPYYIGTVKGDVVSSWTAILNRRYENQSLQSDIRIIKASLIEQLQNYIDKLS